MKRKKKSKKNSINKRTGSDFVKITINDDCLNECTKSLSHHDSANASIPSAVEKYVETLTVFKKEYYLQNFFSIKPLVIK